jgi:hypothetical protein
MAGARDQHPECRITDWPRGTLRVRQLRHTLVAHYGEAGAGVELFGWSSAWRARS